MGIISVLRVWGEMVRFSHSVFALPFALAAMFLAGRHLPSGLPHPLQITLVLVCMIAARSFAMTFNRLADASIDERNPRTAGRPLCSGRITRRGAWTLLAMFAAALLLACAGFRLLYDNAWPLRLSLPTLLLLAGYSYTKRFTILSHFALGAAIGFSPIAAWIAIAPASLGWSAIILGGAVVLWIGGFDIIYACQDVEVDRRDDLRSIPARWGIGPALWVSRLAHAATVLLLTALGWIEGLGWLYASAVGVTAILLAAEQAVVKPTDLSRVNLAFFTINGCVSLLFGAATIADSLLSLPGR